MCVSCHQHQIPDSLLIQYFYEGLLTDERSNIDAASGGAFMTKTVPEAQALIKRAAESRKQFSTRSGVTSRLDEVSIAPLNKKIEDLTNMVQRFMAGSGQVQHVKACGICFNMITQQTCALPFRMAIRNR